MYDLAWWKGWLKKQNPGASPLLSGDSPWLHPILCGMFGSKIHPPTCAGVPCGSVGRVAAWAGSVPAALPGPCVAAGRS